MIRAFIACVILTLGSSASAAIRIDVPGGWYLDSLPNGAYVALVRGSHLQTNRGRVELPNGGNLLFVRIAADGTRFAGIGHLDDRAYEWNGSSWSSPSMAFGPNAVAYDIRDMLRVVWGPGTPTGSMGWRYLSDSGELVTAEETYADPANHLWEYTIRGDVRCGQGGDEEGLQCLVRGRRVLVEQGVIRFIRFRREGDHLALAWVRQDTASSTLLWLTVAELEAYPTYTLPDNPPPPPPPPPAQPCGDFGPFAAPRLDVIEAVKRDFPNLHGGEIVDQVAHRLNREHGFTGDKIRWGRKARNADGSNPNDDVLTFRCDFVDNAQKKLIDILVDGGGADRPIWDIRPVSEEAGNGFWRAPVSPDRDTDHPPPPPPPPPDELAKRVTTLEKQIAAVKADIKSVEDRLKKLEDSQNGVPEERVLALIDAAFAKAVITGRTQSAGGFLSHSHAISGLSIERRQ